MLVWLAFLLRNSRRFNTLMVWLLRLDVEFVCKVARVESVFHCFYGAPCQVYISRCAEFLGEHVHEETLWLAPSA